MGSLAPQRPSYLTLPEPAFQHHLVVDEDDGQSVAVSFLPRRPTDVEDFERPAPAPCLPLDHRQGSRAQRAAVPGEEANRCHRGIVTSPMRPATVLTIVTLLLLITIAGVVFVVQLLSLD